MNREGAIVTSFVINRPNQVNFFQVRIPREVENIIGVETGLVWTSGTLPTLTPPKNWSLPLVQNRNIVAGELKLQSYEKANIFYAGEVVIDQNKDYADFSSLFFTPQLYTHQAKTHEDEVTVNGNTTLIQGVYRDRIATQAQGPYAYKVTVYLWGACKVEQINN